MKKLFGLLILTYVLMLEVASAQQTKLYCAGFKDNPNDPQHVFICQTVCEQYGMGFQSIECNTPRVKQQCGEYCGCICY